LLLPYFTFLLIEVEGPDGGTFVSLAGRYAGESGAGSAEAIAATVSPHIASAGETIAVSSGPSLAAVSI
jgi:hypothetical protein